MRGRELYHSARERTLLRGCLVLSRLVDWQQAGTDLKTDKNQRTCRKGNSAPSVERPDMGHGHEMPLENRLFLFGPRCPCKGVAQAPVFLSHPQNIVAPGEDFFLRYEHSYGPSAGMSGATCRKFDRL
jgi:hypothetical protein